MGECVDVPYDVWMWEAQQEWVSRACGWLEGVITGASWGTKEVFGFLSSSIWEVCTVTNWGRRHPRWAWRALKILSVVERSELSESNSRALHFSQLADSFVFPVILFSGSVIFAYWQILVSSEVLLSFCPCVSLQVSKFFKNIFVFLPSLLPPGYSPFFHLLLRLLPSQCVKYRSHQIKKEVEQAFNFICGLSWGELLSSSRKHCLLVL